MYSHLASPRATIERLRELGLYTKKSLGQHFLIDDNIVGRIIRLSQVSADDTVIEVGPGIGTLTLALLGQGCFVVAVEYDDSLIEPLKEITDASRITVVQADAARLALSREEIDVRSERVYLTDIPTKLVANLPYQVAATVVLRFFEHLPLLQSATVMVQREVADRMRAKIGVKDYSGYTVKLGLLATVVDSFHVAPSSFLPPPRVDSTVVHLQRQQSVQDIEEYQRVAQVIDTAFHMRRKTLRNNLRVQFTADEADRALASTGISGSVRAETLGKEEFIALTHALHASE